MSRGDLQNHLTKRTGLCWIIWGIVQLFPIGTRSSLAFLLQIRHKTSLCAQAKGKMAERVLSFSKPAKVRCCYLTTFTWIMHEKTRVLLRQSSDWGYTLRYWVLRSVKTVDSCLPVGIEAASTCCFHYMAWSCSLVNKIPAERGLLRRKGVELILLGFFPIYLPVRLTASKIQLTFQRTSSCWGWSSLKSLALSLRIVNATQIHLAAQFSNLLKPGLKVTKICSQVPQLSCLVSCMNFMNSRFLKSHKLSLHTLPFFFWFCQYYSHLTGKKNKEENYV